MMKVITYFWELDPINSYFLLYEHMYNSYVIYSTSCYPLYVMERALTTIYVLLDKYSITSNTYTL